MSAKLEGARPDGVVLCLMRQASNGNNNKSSTAAAATNQLTRDGRRSRFSGAALTPETPSLRIF